MDETTPTETTPAPQDRMAKARAAKKARQTAKKEATGGTSDVSMAAIILDLQRQITELKSAPTPMTIPPAPPPSFDNPPGTMVKVFEDKSGNAVYQKVRWNKKSIEAAYPPVTFTPVETLLISPSGVRYQLNADQEVTVPSIVKDTYDNYRKERANLYQRYRGWRSGDRDSLEDRVNDNPGTRQWSRVARLPAIGIDVNSGGWEPPKESSGA